jgi:hypothetical protein
MTRCGAYHAPDHQRGHCRRHSRAGVLFEQLGAGADADWDRCLQRPTRACNLLFSAIRPWPGQKRDPKLIAESVPQLLRMAQSIDERRRAEVLIVIANALSN